MSVKRLEVTRDTQQGRAAPALKGDTHCTRGREDRLLPGPTGAVPGARKDPAGQRLPFKPRPRGPHGLIGLRGALLAPNTLSQIQPSGPGTVGSQGPTRLLTHGPCGRAVHVLAAWRLAPPSPPPWFPSRLKMEAPRDIPCCGTPGSHPARGQLGGRQPRPLGPQDSGAAHGASSASAPVLWAPRTPPTPSGAVTPPPLLWEQ